jgi:hypothetical protein
MGDWDRRTMLFGLWHGAAVSLTVALVPTAALCLPLAGSKPAPVGEELPRLEELAQVVVVHPRRRHRRRRRGRRRVCWWHRGRRVCGWR